MANVEMIKIPPMQVRVGKVLVDGEVVGADVYTMDHFGGVLPNVGDHFMLVRTADDYETVSVQRRYFVTEAASRSIYWLLVVKAAEACSQFTQVATNALAVSDYQEASREGRSLREVTAKLRKANGAR